MKHTIQKDNAVSPVVGVMLMLVVTIIIAAVVSAFAGGMASSQEKVPQASVIAKEVVIHGVRDTTATACPGANCWGQGLPRPDHGTDAAADIYIVFEHKSGDALNLDKVGFYLGKLSEPGVGTLISRSLTPQTGPNLVTSQGNFGTIGNKPLISGWSQNWNKYIEKYPARSSTVVAAGDAFVLHADYGVRSGSGVNYIAWLQEGLSYPFPVAAGDVLTYDLIDTNSKKVISSGQIMIPEFTVATT